MKVEVLETTLVAPSEATPRHGIWLSNLDLAVPKTHTPLVYYYPKPEGADDDAGSFLDPARLRDALARALVPFYPLAGRLANGPGGRIEIDCTGEGALFAVAKADFTGDEVFREFEPSPEARRLLVPFAESGEPPCLLAMVQVRPRLAPLRVTVLLYRLAACRLPTSLHVEVRFACPCPVE
jgi:shikimate O-hydroxycinnamoyltransferase